MHKVLSKGQFPAWFPETPHQEKLIAYYDRLLDQYGDDPKSLDWHSAATQQARFEVLFQAFQHFLTPENKLSLLDVGCGLGHFLTWLEVQAKTRPFHVDYYGIDLSPRLIAKAKERHPNGAFYVADLFRAPFNRPFDVVIASGVFNVKVSEDAEPLLAVQAALRKMFALTQLGLAVNFQSVCGMDADGQGKADTSRYYFYHPEEIVGVSRLITPHFLLRHDYLGNDFTLYLYH